MLIYSRRSANLLLQVFILKNIITILHFNIQYLKIFNVEHAHVQNIHITNAEDYIYRTVF